MRCRNIADHIGGKPIDHQAASFVIEVVKNPGKPRFDRPYIIDGKGPEFVPRKAANAQKTHRDTR